jgi:hypothetical protein
MNEEDSKGKAYYLDLSKASSLCVSIFIYNIKYQIYQKISNIDKNTKIFQSGSKCFEDNLKDSENISILKFHPS